MGQHREKCVCPACGMPHALKFLTKYCPQCGGPKTPAAALCWSCSIATRRTNRSTALTERQRQIWELWNSIPDDYGRVTRIAEMLGLNPGTVRVHYNRARERVRRKKDVA